MAILITIKKGQNAVEKDISNIVVSVSLVTHKSKSGKSYIALRVIFINGYVIDIDVTTDQLFILNNL